MRSALARAAVRTAAIVACAAVLQAAGCAREPASPQGAASPAAPRPSILLVTLDTTRADAIGPEAVGIQTPAFNALAARGRRFRQAYAPVPETLPSHISMMTGLYPAGHGIHENGRFVPAGQALLAERLHAAGYETAAFVSSFILTKRFGLARGFDVYDEKMPEGRQERTAGEVTDAALAALSGNASAPLFLWVHYWDPHYPYTPPEPFKSRFPKNPYLGEVAHMDAELARLLRAFEERARRPIAVILVGDHGEGLGEHGEALHGNLLYQSTMHVPLAVTGPGVQSGTSDAPVSTRRVYHTILDWAGLGGAHSLRTADGEPVLGEAMKPFLNYGWQPQVMAVDGPHKFILAGRVEIYDVAGDQRETTDLAAQQGQSPLPPAALRDYPVPSPSVARPPGNLDPEARKTLASLGYVSAGAAPIVRKDAPRPADMTALFGPLERASGLFVAGQYAQVIPLLEKILAADPYNVDAVLRLATAHSSLGHGQRAVGLFQKAAQLAPQSEDVRLYLALHYGRGTEWAQAAPVLEQIVAASPDRLPAVEGLALVRVRQGRIAEAVSLLRKVYELREPTTAELARLGEMAMAAGQTDVAIGAYEGERRERGRAFGHDLELGVLYLSARRFDDARAALDRVPATHPAYPMALFKRAQVSVRQGQPDAAGRIDQARRRADATTRELIAGEKLFVGVR